MILAPGQANCTVCCKAPVTGNGACPIRELYETRVKLDGHDCGSFKPLNHKQLAKRHPADVDQPALF